MVSASSKRMREESPQLKVVNRFVSFVARFVRVALCWLDSVELKKKAEKFESSKKISLGRGSPVKTRLKKTLEMTECVRAVSLSIH